MDKCKLVTPVPDRDGSTEHCVFNDTGLARKNGTVPVSVVNSD